MTKTCRPLLVSVVGPTASGKTDLAVALARHYQTEIISSDSRQVYRGMAIGTAQPDEAQLAEIRHHFISVREVTERFTSGQFEEEGLKTLSEIFSRKNIAVMVGGSGLYIDALCHGFDDIPEVDPAIREELTERLEKEGLETLAAELAELDPDYHLKVDLSNPNRIIRALEICRGTGIPYSCFRHKKRAERYFDLLTIGTDIPREILYDRINRRVDRMIENRLEEEARKLYEYRNYNALQTVGYRELFEYFAGRITRLEAIEAIKRNTRRYAKRQMTWFRHKEDIIWISPDDISAVITLVDNRMS